MRRLLTILAVAAFSTAYVLAPYLTRESTPYQLESFRAMLLATAAVVAGTLASAYYLRTGHIPFLPPSFSAQLGPKAVAPEPRLSAAERQQLIAELSKTLSEPVAARLANLVTTEPRTAGDASAGRSTVAAVARPATPAEILDRKILDISSRLQRQIPELGKRANLNLLFGIFFALGGMVVLWWAASRVFESVDAMRDWHAVLVSALPRLSLAVVVELFSYFFLSLYRTSLSEINYFENEITTAEVQLLALRTAVASGDVESVRSVVQQCAKVERNFRLSKDESTVELERERINNSFADKIIDRLGDLLKK